MATTSRSANTECRESCQSSEGRQRPADGTGHTDHLARGESERMAEDLRPAGGPHLTGEEEEATRKFLENVNKWRSARQLEEVRVLDILPSLLQHPLHQRKVGAAPAVLCWLLLICLQIVITTNMCSFPGPPLSSS